MPFLRLVLSRAIGAVFEIHVDLFQAVNRLGLNTVSPFDYKTRIIEYATNSADSFPLINLKVKDFVGEVAARKPAPGLFCSIEKQVSRLLTAFPVGFPGGGSVAALIGSMVSIFYLVSGTWYLVPSLS